MEKKDLMLIGIIIVLIIVVALGIGSIKTIKSTQTTDSGARDNTLIECLPGQRNADACIEIYDPVCAVVNVQCVTTPCNPALQTFSNSCHACSNPLVSGYIEGKC